MTFTSSGGVTATVGHDGFGIFLRPDQVSGQSFSTFYLGYDDQVTNQDDNHDDFIVRATVRPAVPEPATWAMMLVGFGAMGVSLRRRRRTNNLLQAALGQLRSLKGSNLARLRPFCCPVRWVPRKLAIVRFGWNADVRKLDDVIATNASVGA